MATSPTSTFTLALQDQISPAARAGTAALTAYRAEMVKNQTQLKQLQTAYSRLKAGGLGATEQAKQLRAQMAGLKSSSASAQANVLSLGGALDEVKPPKSAVEAFVESLAGAGGPLGQVGTALQKIGGMGPLILGAGAAAIGLLAVAAAAVAAASATIALTAAVVRYGIEAAGTARSEALHLEGLTRIRTWSGVAAGSSSELTASIARVSSIAAIGRSQITGYAESIYRLGLRGRSADIALEAASIAAAAGGDAIGRRYLGLAAGAARTGRSVAAVADDVRRRFGDVNARMNLDLGRQSERLRQSFTDMFAGSRVSAAFERFAHGLGTITELFSQSSASGRAMRGIVEAIFPNVLDTVTELGPAVRHVFQDLVYGATRAAIVVVRLRMMWRGLWETITGGMAAASAAGAAIDGVVRAYTSPLRMLGELLQSAQHWWHDIGANSAAGLVDGLTAGLRLRASSAVSAVRELAGSVRGAFEVALDMHSPSRVFAEYGVNITDGLVEGVERGRRETDAAVGAMVAAPTAGPARGAGGGGPVITVGDLHIHTTASTASGIAGDIVGELASALEGIFISGGSPA